MSEEQKKWYTKGYNDQCWGYPLLDHAWEWGLDKKHPKIYQKYYRMGQSKAYEDGKAECPWFHPDYTPWLDRIK